MVFCCIRAASPVVSRTNLFQEICSWKMTSHNHDRNENVISVDDWPSASKPCSCFPLNERPLKGSQISHRDMKNKESLSSPRQQQKLTLTVLNGGVGIYAIT